MATLVLQVAGSVIGDFIAGPIGALIGQVAGAVAGSAIDQQIFGRTRGRSVQGPRLKSLEGLSSTEGAPIPRVYGRVRVGGQIVWATRFEETVTRTAQKAAGGKGGGAKSTATTYNYFANFAVGLCEGEVALLRRVWADGKELDVSKLTLRFYKGSETQSADPLIVAKQGAGNAPAYRGLAYVVFEHLPLADYGNRIPQLSFEIVKPVAGLAGMIRAVDLIPGATEFGYSVGAVTRFQEAGVSFSENRNLLSGRSNWTASIDALQALCPNLVSVALVVAWFGDDLRAGYCTVAPRVESAVKDTGAAVWSVAGLTRATARVVSLSAGLPAYGGTPSDATVVAAIVDLKARGLSVVFYPFVMMDIAAGNALPDPWSNALAQPAYPWRGRIACFPAPGVAGTVDGTAAAGTQIASFVGTASPPAAEWSLRRFILACAGLCAQAGGVSAFLVGSEFAALTRVRSASGVYPLANALATLATDVKALLGAGTKISYAADWTEYNAHVLGGGAEVRFPLDVVWGSASVDFVGIDVYWPLSDWRDGTAHLDAAEAASVYDRDYLARRHASGEAFDWYYASDANRTAQVRTPITDGAYAKPWVFRAKDLIGWWSNAHKERVAGIELGGTTAWAAASKPVWFTEIGCPAIDRGANAPNYFADAKSSASGIPPFSRGSRDDLMQTRMLEAALTRFDPGQPGYVAGANPVSGVYGGLMVDPARIHIWAWDARPYPAFPNQSAVWADAANWETGHWITGRIEGLPLDRLVAAILSDSGVPNLSAALPPVQGFLDGYVLDRTLSARGALEPLATLYGFDGAVSGGSVRFAGRSARAVRTLSETDLVASKEGRFIELVRAQESDLPREIATSFIDAENDYRIAAVYSRRIEGYARRASHGEFSAVLRRAQAQQLMDVWLQDLWIGRETIQFSLRPSLIELEIGDTVTLPVAGVARQFLIQKITDGSERRVSARAIEPLIYDRPVPALARTAALAPRLPGPPRVVVLDLALSRDTPETLQHIAVFADPWNAGMAVWRQAGGTYELLRIVERPALIGDTQSPLGPGPAGRFDYASSVTVRFASGAPSSVSDVEMLNGKTACAIKGSDGAWEIVSFGLATLVADKTYRLSKLLRGLGGEEALCQRTVGAGATLVLLDSAVVPLASGLAALGGATRYRIGPADLDYTDASYVEIVSTVSAKALKPYPPVRAKAVRSGAGVTISFLRRGRRESDAWEPLDIPLGEDSEAYEIDIFSGVTLKRTLSAVTPSVLYAAASETADFGAAQTALSVAVYQKSAAAGRGFGLAAALPVL